MRIFTFRGGRSGFVTPEPPPDVAPFTVSHVWIGAVTDDGATIKFRSVDAVAASVLVSTSPALTSPVEVVATEGVDDVWTAVVSGLAAETQYYYGFDGSDDVGEFRTWPVEGDPFSFLMALAGDTGSSETYGGATGAVANPPTWDRMLEHDPLFMLLLGDFNYRNLSTSNPATYRQALKDCLAESHPNAFFRLCPVAYTWDDHDYSTNDSSGAYANKAVPAQVYREYVPHWPLGESSAIYHTFVVGRVRFINLDSRYYRSPNSTAAGPSKRRLGTVQETWLEGVLTAATEPVIVLNILSWIGFTSGFSDGWANFTHARTDLLDMLRDTGTFDRVFLVGADIHELQYDDGTHTNFETGASVPGPPFGGFAPIDCSFNHFSASCQEAYQTRKQQYGTLEFTDTGSQITLRARGYALSAAPGATSVVKFDHSIVYPG